MSNILIREKGAHTPHGTRNRRNPTHSLQKRLHRRLQKRLRKRIRRSHRKNQTQTHLHKRTIPTNQLRMRHNQLPPSLRKQTNHKRRRRTPMLRLRQNNPTRRHTQLLQPPTIKPNLNSKQTKPTYIFLVHPANSPKQNPNSSSHIIEQKKFNIPPHHSIDATNHGENQHCQSGMATYTKRNPQAEEKKHTERNAATKKAHFQPRPH